MNFIETFHDVLVRNPGKELVFEVHGDRLDGATSTELADLLAKARGTLRAQGLKAGDRAVLVAPNGIHWVATDLALLFEGAVVVPMYARQDPAELVEMMHDCAPTVVVVATGALADAIGAHWPEAPIVCFSELFMGAPVVELPVSRSDDDPVTIIYTSGTSGVPKGVVSTVANVNFMLPMTATALTAMMGEGEGDDRVFHYLPFCFSGSRVVLWTCLWRANPIHVSTDLDNLAVELKTARPNYLLNVPMLLDRIRNGVEGKLAERGAFVQWVWTRGSDAWKRRAAGQGRRGDRAMVGLARRLIFGRVREQIGSDLACLICGSAPLSVDTQQWFEMLGIPVYQVYGLTETTAIVTMDRPPEVIAGRVGPAIEGVELRVSDTGELQVRGPNVFWGYHNRPEATEAAFEDGWFRTGDRAELVDGTWRILGRVKNLLVPSSGHNVAPEPIEQKLVEGIQGVEQAVVVGHGRPFLGAILTGTLDADAIDASVEQINQDLPHYRRIRRVHVSAEPFSVENGLLTANRKLRRGVIEAHYADQVEAFYA